MGSDYGSAEQAPGPGIVGNQEEQNGKITGCGVDARGKWTSDGCVYGCLPSIDFSWTK